MRPETSKHFTAIRCDVPQELLAFVASSAEGLFALSTVERSPDHPLHGRLETFLSSIPADTVEQVLADETFRCLYLDRNGQQAAKADRLARFYFAEEFLKRQTSTNRMEVLRQAQSEHRPQPYSSSALADLVVGPDNLVPLRAFTYDGSRLNRNQYAFLLLSTTGAPNSTYWLLRAFHKEGIAQDVSVRLDPFLFGPAATVSEMAYKMVVYGRPLDWNRIARIEDQEHGRWYSDNRSDRTAFTDYCWSRRDGEVHFVCEEVPAAAEVQARAARYLHAIYDPVTMSITHFDGALRLYTGGDFEKRKDAHVRNVGKLGIREKVFRVERPVSRDVFSVITQAFFIWNDDVAKYFREEVEQK